MQIIGLSGKAGSGKDAIYENVLRPRGWKKWSLAHPMKAMGIGYGFSIEEVTQTKPPHVREWMQRYGTEEHRDRHGKDFWLRVATYWVHVLGRDMGITKICFTDVRFPNEAIWITEDMGGKLVRVVGRGGLDGDAALHPSETALDGWTSEDFDVVLNNRTNGFEQHTAELLAEGIIL